jgi:hypothetical protein
MTTLPNQKSPVKAGLSPYLSCTYLKSKAEAPRGLKNFWAAF